MSDDRVRPVPRFLAAVALLSVIYVSGLYLVPRLPFLVALREAHAWIGPGDITQVTFLVLSILAIAMLGRGRAGRFAFHGFRGTTLAALGRAYAVGLSASALLWLVGLVISNALVGGEPKSGGDGPPESNVVAIILSVWFVASTCEEVFYRGLLQRFLAPLSGFGLGRGRWRVSLPIAFGALAFGLGHLCLLGILPGPIVAQIVISGVFLGVLAGRALERTGSLLPAIAIHMSFNITGMLIPTLLSAF